MEPLSQGLLGAAVGQLAAPSLGRRALLWGGLVGMSPDLDVLLAPLRDGFGELVHHRGTSHALWFGFVVGPPLGWLLWRLRDPDRGTPVREWIALCVLALFTHPVLDAFTPYGTQFFAPFDRTRIAWNGVGIVDPFYSVILAWAVVRACRVRVPGARERRRTVQALVLSSLYLVVGVALNDYARRDVRALVGESAEIRVYPTALQPFLRRVVVRDGATGLVGWHSTFAPGCPWWEPFALPEATPESRAIADSWEGETLRWFALGDVVAHTSRLPGGALLVEIEDLRYGLPGMRPDRGLWGVRAIFEQGRRLGSVQRFQRPAGDAMLAGFVDWTLGRFEGTGLRGAHPPSCAGGAGA